MKMKGFLWVAGYAAFMIGYFLILTILLPSTLVYEPDWIRVGNYAEYRVGNWIANKPTANGTYTWRIVAVYHVDGRTVVRELIKHTLEQQVRGTFHLRELWTLMQRKELRTDCFCGSPDITTIIS